MTKYLAIATHNLHIGTDDLSPIGRLASTKNRLPAHGLSEVRKLECRRSLILGALSMESD